jgi:16S rRNA (uracil1498-N3)-methyltransferase
MVIGMQRYFVKEKIDNTFKIIDDYHHVVNVMRMKIGEKLEVSYQGIIYLCTIIKITNGFVLVQPIDKISQDNELDINVAIAQALVRDDKFSLIIQKTTELGVKKIIPLITERSIIKLDDKRKLSKIKRWHHIAKEASEQSKRNNILEVTPIMTMEDLTKLPYDYKLLCSPREKEKSIKKVLQSLSKNDTILVIVGPEGGLTPKEEAFLIKHGFISVSLGSRILRTETVPIFLASIINYELMR